MEAQKAVEELRIEHCIKNQNCTDSCQHGENICPYDMAINALEKQIAKKPVGLKKNICPNCSWIVVYKCDSYCPRCGQRILWSDSEV